MSYSRESFLIESSHESIVSLLLLPILLNKSLLLAWYNFLDGLISILLLNHVLVLNHIKQNVDDVFNMIQNEDMIQEQYTDQTVQKVVSSQQ
jgi:hypothetical protein